MKFWELVSSFHGEPWVVSEVVSRPEWREPYERWLDRWRDPIDTQDRDVLDAAVPESLSREVARLSSQRFLYSPLRGIVRASWPEGGFDPGPLEELTALALHDRFGGWAIEEIGEFGSMRVCPSQVEDVYEPPKPHYPCPLPTSLSCGRVYPWPTGRASAGRVDAGPRVAPARASLRPCGS